MVASLRDSRCDLDTQGGSVANLTVDHRLEDNVEEREHVTASGGEVERLSIYGGAEIGPRRCWPGGLYFSRSIEDMDVGEFIVPVPYVKQVKLSNVGRRFIIASNGLWDVLSSDASPKTLRRLPSELAARQVIKGSDPIFNYLDSTYDERPPLCGCPLGSVTDDTTCIVVGIIPSDPRCRCVIVQVQD